MNTVRSFSCSFNNCIDMLVWNRCYFHSFFLLLNGPRRKRKFAKRILKYIYFFVLFQLISKQASTLQIIGLQARGIYWLHDLSRLFVIYLKRNSHKTMQSRLLIFLYYIATQPVWIPEKRKNKTSGQCQCETKKAS